MNVEDFLMIKICFVTAARSEYGLLKWLMKAVEASSEFELQIVVTGGHLLEEQGYTINQIKRDGFHVNSEVDAHFDLSTQEGIAASMGRLAEGMAHAFATLQPDYVVVLGDRYELLPICNTAFVMGIPIVHISGGDVTEGAIDDGIRNAVTMLATYHFPGTQDSYTNVCRMRGKGTNVWAVGETSVDVVLKESLIAREQIAACLDLNVRKKWILMTYHPETRKSLEYNLRVVQNCCDVLNELPDTQIIITYANADFGGAQINAYLKKRGCSEKNRYRIVPSLGNAMYLSLMKNVEFVIGNSSSGIVDTPLLKIPAINIGDRQKGRYLCGNIIQCGSEYEDILEAIIKVQRHEVNYSDCQYWGDGYTSERIYNILKRNICGGKRNE